MILRHHDYTTGPLTVPVEGIQGAAIPLDSDAPFVLRRIRSRGIGLDGWRFQTPRRQYQSPVLRTDVIPIPAGTNFRPSRGVIIEPELVYPANGALVYDIGNSTGQPIENAQLLFRGSKIYADGMFPTLTYPARMSPLAFTYPVNVQNMPVVGTLRDNQLRIDSDADFAYRYGVCDPFRLAVEGGPVQLGKLPGNDGPTYTELYAMLKDEGRKPYSNLPVHINDLFGQANPVSSGVGGNDDLVLFFPGMPMPEIYLPREHSLYFDLFRDDDPATNFPVDLAFRFQGSKVFKR